MAALLLCAACGSTGSQATALELEESNELALAHVDVDLADGAAGAALQLISALQAQPNLPATLRVRSEAQAKTAVGILSQDAAQERGRWSAEQLEGYSRLGLPLQQRARLTVAAGRAHLRENSRIRAFKLLRDFEESNPGHPERQAAGEVISQAGFSMIVDRGRYGLFGRYRSRGIGALELLVLRFPFHASCPAAYVALADAYEENGDLELAIERLEDLLLYHPDNALVSASEARLPRLRMASVERDDYDRSGIERARVELEAWLTRYEGRAGVEPQQVTHVRGLLSESYLRLAKNDLIVARYHRRIKQPFGTKQHAERALDQAQRSQEALEALDVDRFSKERTVAIENARELINWAWKKEADDQSRVGSSNEGGGGS